MATHNHPYQTTSGEPLVQLDRDGVTTYQTLDGSTYNGQVIPNSGLTTNPTVINSPSGNNQSVVPDFGSIADLVPGTIDFNAALNQALGVGSGNVSTFLGNIQKTRQSALDLVNTDVEGIQNAVNKLSPFARQQGDQDLQTNTQRAGKIDAFNLSRIPGFNEFNRAEKSKSVGATGLDYQNRTNKLLSQLDAQSQGRLSDGTLDTLLTRTARNRGADIASATGAGSRSGASVGIQDRLDINQRLNLIQDAQGKIPGVLNSAQQLLETPTIFGQPTEVPLNVSNIADKIPVTSNISAGQANQALALEANRLSTITPSEVLTSNLNTQQANVSNQLAADQFNINNDIGFAVSEAEAIQGGINADKGDEIRNQQFEQFQAGIDKQNQAQNIQAGASILGGLLGNANSQPNVGGINPNGTSTSGTGVLGSIVNGIKDGVGTAFETVASGIGSVLSAGAGFIDSTFGNGDGKLSFGGAEISTSDITDFFNVAKGNVSSTISPTNAQEGTHGTQSLPGIFGNVAIPSKSTQKATNIGIQSAALVSNWDKLSPDKQIQGVSQMSAEILEDKGVITSGQKDGIMNATNTLATIANPNATPEQKGIAIASAINQYGIKDPRLSAGLSAVAVLTSDASNEQKLLALGGMGLSAAHSSEILSTVEAVGPAAALSLINTAQNFDKMNPIQQAASIYNTGGAVMTAFQQMGLLSSVPAFAPASGVAAGAVVGQLQLSGVNNILHGKDPSLIESAALFTITGGLDRLVKPATEALGFGGGANNRNLQQRDAAKFLGILSPNRLDGFGTFKDSSGATVKLGDNPINPGKNKTHSYAVEQTDPIGTALAVQMVKNGYQFKGGENLKSLSVDISTKLAGGLVKNAKSNEDVLANTKALIEQYGFDRDTLYASVQSLTSGDKLPKGITKSYVNSMLAGIDRIFGVTNPNAGKGGSEEFPLLGA